LCRECVRSRGIHAFCFVNESELIPLDLGHKRDLITLHRTLVVVDLELALGGEISAGSHRQRISDMSCNSRDYDCFVLLRSCRTYHSGNKAEVCGESVIETVHNISQESA